MKRSAVVLALTLGLAGVSAPSASAQLFGFPDYAIPVYSGTTSSWFAGSFATGLNDASGKLNAYGVAGGMVGESVSFSGGLGLVDGAGDTEPTLGARVAVPLSSTESYALSAQAGLGWMSQDVGTLGSFTFIRIPVGVAISGSVDSGEAMITPWGMPRLNFVRTSSDAGSDTSTDLGVSGGVSFNFPSGFGIHTALDVLFADGGEPIVFGVGGHFTPGGGN